MVSARLRQTTVVLTAGVSIGSCVVQNAVYDDSDSATSGTSCV
jgi:hypothetical protein